MTKPSRPSLASVSEREAQVLRITSIANNFGLKPRSQATEGGACEEFWVSTIRPAIAGTVLGITSATNSFGLKPRSQATKGRACAEFWESTIGPAIAGTVLRITSTTNSFGLRPRSQATDGGACEEFGDSAIGPAIAATESSRSSESQAPQMVFGLRPRSQATEGGACAEFWESTIGPAIGGTASPLVKLTLGVIQVLRITSPIESFGLGPKSQTTESGAGEEFGESALGPPIAESQAPQIVLASDPEARLQRVELAQKFGIRYWTRHRWYYGFGLKPRSQATEGGACTKFWESTTGPAIGGTSSESQVPQIVLASDPEARLQRVELVRNLGNLLLGLATAGTASPLMKLTLGVIQVLRITSTTNSFGLRPRSQATEGGACEEFGESALGPAIASTASPLMELTLGVIQVLRITSTIDGFGLKPRSQATEGGTASPLMKLTLGVIQVLRITSTTNSFGLRPRSQATDGGTCEEFGDSAIGPAIAATVLRITSTIDGFGLKPRSQATEGGACAEFWVSTIGPAIGGTVSPLIKLTLGVILVLRITSATNSFGLRPRSQAPEGGACAEFWVSTIRPTIGGTVSPLVRLPLGVILVLRITSATNSFGLRPRSQATEGGACKEFGESAIGFTTAGTASPLMKLTLGVIQVLRITSTTNSFGLRPRSQATEGGACAEFWESTIRPAIGGTVSPLVKLPLGVILVLRITSATNSFGFRPRSQATEGGACAEFWESTIGPAIGGTTQKPGSRRWSLLGIWGLRYWTCHSCYYSFGLRPRSQATDSGACAEFWESTIRPTIGGTASPLVKLTLGVIQTVLASNPEARQQRVALAREFAVGPAAAASVNPLVKLTLGFIKGLRITSVTNTFGLGPRSQTTEYRTCGEFVAEPSEVLTPKYFCVGMTSQSLCNEGDGDSHSQ
ncbi:hypothetical protein C8R44DRAFT_863363 [Mycena epipterygia]|nr:hypothetical protein C8R44DRAFT_863363 [Mycena epipterygia]